MSYEIEVPKSVEGGNFLRIPGTYHLVVLDVDEQPTKRGGELIDGFRVKCDVLDGTVQVDGACTEIGKSVDIMFFAPKLTQPNDGEFNRKRISRFLMATNLLPPDALGKKAEAELQDAVGKQFVATLELTKDGKFLELSFLDLWHVDDPAAKGFPKSAQGLSMLPADERWVDGKPGTKDGQVVDSPPAQEEAVDLDDI